VNGSAEVGDARVAVKPVDRWRTALLALGVLLVGIVLLYLDTAIVMVGIWSRSETFAHAFLVPPISLWLIWRRRELLAQMTPRPSPWLLLGLAAFGAAWLAGDLVVVNALTQLALVLMIIVAVPAVLGLAVAREIAFPLAFLLFSVPIGEFMLPMLMEATADFTVAALTATGIPVYREGLQFVIPSGAWSVVEACSGVRYLIASLMVGTLFAYLNYRSMKRRWIFVGISIVVPILANWLRAYMIVMLGHLSNNTIAVGVDHLIYGWVFFGVVIMLMFMIGSRWSEPDEPLGADSAPGRRVAGLAAAADAAGMSLWTVALLGLAVAAAAPAAVWALGRDAASASAPRLALPATLQGGWTATDRRITDWKPIFANPRALVQRSYVGPTGAVGLDVAYYRAQGYDSKLVTSENALVDGEGKGLNKLGTEVRQVSIGGQSVTVRISQLQQSPSLSQVSRPRIAVWQFYWIDGQIMAGDMRAKLLTALARVSGRGDDGASLIFFAADEDPDVANRRVADFVQAHGRTIADSLRSTRDTR